MDDTHKHFSPNYNNRSRQALSSNWTAKWPVTQSNEAPRPTQQSSSEGSLPSNNASTGDATLGAIAIQGLSPGISGPLDFGKPVVRTYPNNDHDPSYTSRCPAVQHIDVMTEWNFSKYAEAQELCRIHQAFTITLERLLASELWKVYFQDCIPKIGEDERCHSAEVVRGISFCREQLVGDMADSLYSTQEDIRVRAQLGLIRLYLVASDCLVQYDGPHSRDTSITVRVHHDARSQTPYPFVQAAWVPDSIVFNELDETRLPREGQEFSLIPRYQCNSAFASTRFPTDVRYCIESQYTPLSWLTWDYHLAGFKGIVPIYSATQPGGYDRSLFAPNGSLCIDVKAVIVEDHGSSVHFERTVRARLTIDILPWDDTFGPSPCQGTGSDPTQYSFSAQRVECIPPTIDMSSVYTPSSSQAYDNREFIFSSEHVRKAARMHNFAQKHAYQTAKHADMSQRLENAEMRVKLLDSLGGYDSAQMQQQQQQQPGLQGHLPGYEGFTPLAKFSDTGAPIVGDPFASSHLSRYALYNRNSSLRADLHQVAPPSPRLDGRTGIEDQAIESRSNVRFPALPPPAVRSAQSQAFDHITQAWTRMYTPQITPTCHGRRSGSDTHQVNCILENSHTSRSRNDVLNANYHRARLPAEEDGGDPGSAGAAINLAAPFIGTHHEAKTAKSERGSRKRYARSNLSNASPSKSPNENESQSRTTTSGSGIASYNCYSSLRKDRNSPLDASGVQEASFLDLPNSIGSSEGDASVPMRRGQRRLRTRTDSGYHLDVHNIESVAQPLQILANPVQFLYGVPTPPDSLSNMSPTASDPEAGAGELQSRECGYGQDRPKKMYTSHQTFIPSKRSVFVHPWQTSSTFSHAASSNIELTVEDHDQIIDRHEQAMVWHKLREDESSDQVDKPGVAEAETRLSEGEKKAIEEAIDRSLEDMTEDFKGVFLNDSDELASGDETVATDEL